MTTAPPSVRQSLWDKRSYDETMAILKRLEPYEDELGNRIEFNGPVEESRPVHVEFRGSGNVLRVESHPRSLRATFEVDDGEITIGTRCRRLSVHARVGQDAQITIGNGVTSTKTVTISSNEGTTVSIGDDCMFATGNEVRADDAHPIFDVRSGRRVNPSRDITIGAHVWLAIGACVLGGSEIGEGSVLGMHSVLKGRMPNNAVAVGSPARVTRRDIAWERPHLSRTAPFYKPDASTVKKSRYWRLTSDVPFTESDPVPSPHSQRPRAVAWLAERLKASPLGPPIKRLLRR